MVWWLLDGHEGKDLIIPSVLSYILGKCFQADSPRIAMHKFPLWVPQGVPKGPGQCPCPSLQGQQESMASLIFSVSGNLKKTHSTEKIYIDAYALQGLNPCVFKNQR